MYEAMDSGIIFFYKYSPFDNIPVAGRGGEREFTNTIAPGVTYPLGLILIWQNRGTLVLTVRMLDV